MTGRHIRRLLGIAVASALVAALGVAGATATGGVSRTSRFATVPATVHVQLPVAENPSSADTDNLQQGDQTTPDTGAEATGAGDPPGDPNAQGPDPAGSETENAADDTPGALGSAPQKSVKTVVTHATSATVKHTQSAKHTKLASVKTVRTADPAGDPNAEGPDNGTETETSGETSNETASDGPGGHEDAAGQDVQHEFQGEE